MHVYIIFSEYYYQFKKKTYGKYVFPLFLLLTNFSPFIFINLMQSDMIFFIICLNYIYILNGNSVTNAESIYIRLLIVFSI